MDEIIARIIDNMIDRVSGPMHFRIYLQPVMASIFAVIRGLQDAKAGRPAYFWQLFAADADRRAILRDGWSSVGRIFIFAMVIDVVYQWIEQRWIYPLEVLITAILLAIVPYVIIRGVVNRIASLFQA